MRLAPQLHRIGNDIVAAYLVETADGITLIDAGLPGHWRDLLRELRAMGRELGDIRGVILTHGDSDHLGFAERLRREHGVPVYIHAADAERAKGGPKPPTAMGRKRLAALVGFFVYAARKGGARTRHLTEVVEIGDGQVLPLPGDPQIVALPGHSPGSVAVYVPAVRAAFVGDALTTRSVLTGEVGPQPAPFTDEPAEALASLDRLAGLDVEWILPGHGAPWRGRPADAVAAVRAAAAQMGAG
ncbi:glyoxylase-like metal-dependent hydrolase (beta-lactamase superfamily II) [Microbacterium sp. SLBN-154]|uniref:MBL fold metallo-hydrolase n=1 Tax=Microbacterium sp. SLBN-154 TaxID=2768458 RepID=UPI001152A6AD|nr:MBL fold metallo-hydrolase [Microbacterium sp. SLBN-154]TQK18750.1 glyoxylase-like metal-dependent hydrolase (beta-lactamase superfamily II) [Microbacterium sp. SLBN-154]